jgi:hypothetical protein
MSASSRPTVSWCSPWPRTSRRSLVPPRRDGQPHAQDPRQRSTGVRHRDHPRRSGPRTVGLQALDELPVSRRVRLVRTSDRRRRSTAPGRSRDARPPSDTELRRTTILRLSIAEASAKVRSGGPIDEPDDLPLPIWAGQVPLQLRSDEPIADVDLPAPDYLAQIAIRR